MPDGFQYDVFLSHSAQDKAVVRPLAERLRKEGLCFPSQLSTKITQHPNDLLNKDCHFLPLRLDDAPGTFTDLPEHRITLNY